jgi:hypothetical protein
MLWDKVLLGNCLQLSCYILLSGDPLSLLRCHSFWAIQWRGHSQETWWPQMLRRPRPEGPAHSYQAPCSLCSAGTISPLHGISSEGTHTSLGKSAQFCPPSVESQVLVMDQECEFIHEPLPAAHVIWQGGWHQMTEPHGRDLLQCAPKSIVLEKSQWEVVPNGWCLNHKGATLVMDWCPTFKEGLKAASSYFNRSTSFPSPSLLCPLSLPFSHDPIRSLSKMLALHLGLPSL